MSTFAGIYKHYGSSIRLVERKSHLYASYSDICFAAQVSANPYIPCDLVPIITNKIEKIAVVSIEDAARILHVRANVLSNARVDRYAVFVSCVIIDNACVEIYVDNYAHVLLEYREHMMCNYNIHYMPVFDSAGDYNYRPLINEANVVYPKHTREQVHEYARTYIIAHEIRQQIKLSLE